MKYIKKPQQNYYTQDLSDGKYKDTMLEFSCTKCGLIPKTTSKQTKSGEYIFTIITQGWSKIDDQNLCKKCGRQEKIKRISNRIKVIVS